MVSPWRRKYSFKLKFSSKSKLSTKDCFWCFHFQTGVAMNILVKLNLDRLDMPNCLSVFLNRTVRGKFAHPRCIENRHPYPVFCLLICLADLILAIYVGLIVCE